MCGGVGVVVQYIVLSCVRRVSERSVSCVHCGPASQHACVPRWEASEVESRLMIPRTRKAADVHRAAWPSICLAACRCRRQDRFGSNVSRRCRSLERSGRMDLRWIEQDVSRDIARSAASPVTARQCILAIKGLHQQYNEFSAHVGALELRYFTTCVMLWYNLFVCVIYLSVCLSWPAWRLGVMINEVN